MVARPRHGNENDVVSYRADLLQHLHAITRTVADAVQVKQHRLKTRIFHRYFDGVFRVRQSGTKAGHQSPAHLWKGGRLSNHHRYGVDFALGRIRFR